MKKELCVPCAIKLAATKDVRKTAYRKEKITCAECGRRKYGDEYAVTEVVAAVKEAQHGNH